MFFIIYLILGVRDVCEGLNFISSQNVEQDLLVLTNKGYVQGHRNVTYTGQKYWAFEGIPYAAPPLENLRFREPQQIQPWKGILDGSKEGSSCVETMNTPDVNVIVMGKEDCLYINVYTPRNPASSTKLLPVMMWFYGGAFLFGNSSSLYYGSDNFLDQDVITVTFNYRLGLFGFLSTEDLESPGNYGLKDQHAAIQWVNKNIKNFGGDKKRVTLNGQSAGSASVFYQMGYKKNKGIFHGIIASSGSPLCSWALQRNPRKIAFDLGAGVGIRTNSSKELVEGLRRANLELLKRASRLILLIFAAQTDREGFPFSPTLEPLHKSAFLTTTTYEMFRTGEFNRVPILMGITTLETLFFSNVLLMLRPLNILYDFSPGSLPSKDMNIASAKERREAGRKILNYYFPAGYVSANQNQLFDYTTDDRFTRPLHKTIQLVSKYTQVYFYLFSYSSEFAAKFLFKITGNVHPIPGVAHFEEQTYFWKRRDIQLDTTGFDKLISRRLLRLWTNFMKTRNPTPFKDPLLQEYIWPPVMSPHNITYLQIDKNFSVHQNYRDEQVQFWDNLYQTYGHPPHLTY